jgi:hypothetical protein
MSLYIEHIKKRLEPFKEGFKAGYVKPEELIDAVNGANDAILLYYKDDKEIEETVTQFEKTIEEHVDERNRVDKKILDDYLLMCDNIIGGNI